MVVFKVFILSPSMKIKPIILAIFLLILDQISKYFFYNQNLLSDFLFIRPSFNTGISRSLPIHLYIVIAVSIIAIIVLLVLSQKKRISQISFVFLLSWTIWNLIDRIFLWWVRDFINIQVFNFPIFNIADVLLNIGIIILLIQEFRLEKKVDKNKS